MANELEKSQCFDKQILNSDEELSMQIVQQLEFYLSEHNLHRDGFFKKEMLKREDGGIPISLLLKCNRLCSMNVTDETLRLAVRCSSIIKISDDGTSLIRSEPLTQMEPSEKRTVFVTGIPRWPFKINSNDWNDSQVDQKFDSTLNDGDSKENTNLVDATKKITWEHINQIREIFGEFGEVLYVNLPHYRTTGTFRGFAFVEFKSSKSAKKAARFMGAKDENENWFVKPGDSSPFESNECPETAWKPRMASKSTFSTEQMLARRYIWQYCSRKNKQLRTAFRQLRQAGYKAPNPFDYEYNLITLGKSTAEARLQYVTESYGNLSKDHMRVFRYLTWKFWNSKFYLWHQEWIKRMQNKTEELSIITIKTAEMDPKDPDMVSTANFPKITNENGISSNVDKLTLDDIQQLPLNFVTNSIVQIQWPGDLIIKAVEKSILTGNDVGEVISKSLGLARRLRISLEKYLLVPSNLLDQVAHVDPNPNDFLLAQIKFSKLCDSKSQCNESSPIGINISDKYYPIFIRFKSADSAREVIDYIRKLQDYPACPFISPLNAFLLEGENEYTYCKTISESRSGVSERRRKAQIRRRVKMKENKITPTPECVFTKQLSCVTHNHNYENKHTVFDD